jgi:hypothetical protein
MDVAVVPLTGDIHGLNVLARGEAPPSGYTPPP